MSSIDKEVVELIKTLYDPKVEQRGFEKGIEKGIERGIKQTAENMIKDGESVDRIKKYSGLSEETINEIKRLIETKGEH
ncbi:MAG: hypothetical protein Q8858_16640 [Bacteroidota bacterium]|nr:hypothetical protein [Bacteroidota bacterium]